MRLADRSAQIILGTRDRGRGVEENLFGLSSKTGRQATYAMGPKIKGDPSKSNVMNRDKKLKSLFYYLCLISPEIKTYAARG
jgi:hypothetical protein